MVFTVRCFKCGETSVKLIMGGRSIIHARCHDCGANLLDEVMQFEKKVTANGEPAPRPPEEPIGAAAESGLGQESSSTASDEDERPVKQS